MPAGLNMPSREEQSRKQDTPSPTRTTRVDAAHTPAQATGKPAPATPTSSEKTALQEQARQLEAHLQRRQQDLDHRESQLNARLAEFEREARASRLELLEKERALKAERESLAQSAKITATSNSAEGNAEQEAQQLTDSDQLRRELQLEHREQGLAERERELRKRINEISAAREETLEIRLATEELWRQLCDALPPEAVNRSVARIRERLSDHYRLVREDLNGYRAQLEQLRTDLDERLERWSHRKAELADWAERQMREIDNYHSAVSERAAAVDQRQSELTFLQAAWRQDRQELEKRVARLQQRLEQAGKATPPAAIPVPHHPSTGRVPLPKSGAA